MFNTEATLPNYALRMLEEMRTTLNKHRTDALVSDGAKLTLGELIKIIDRLIVGQLNLRPQGAPPQKTIEKNAKQSKRRTSLNRKATRKSARIRNKGQ